MKRRGFGRRLPVLLGAFAALMAPQALASTAGAADRLYWANAGGPPASEISFANLDGSGGADLSTSGAPVVSEAIGVAIDAAAGKIYWGSDGSDLVSFANLDGGGGGKLNSAGATGLTDATALRSILRRGRSTGRATAPTRSPSPTWTEAAAATSSRVPQPWTARKGWRSIPPPERSTGPTSAAPSPSPT